MLQLLKFAVASDTTFLVAKCEKGPCDTHTFARDAKGWHEKVIDSLFKKTIWKRIDDEERLSMLNELLEQAEATYLKEK